MLQPRGLLFDFDGTLYGDWRLWIATIQVTLEAFQVNITAHEALEKARRMIEDDSFVNISGVAIALARERGVDQDQEVRVAFLQKMDEIMDASGPGDGLTNLLSNLRKDNFRLGLVTLMRQPRLMRRLEKWKLSDYFELIMTPEQSPEFKPSPKPFVKAIEQLRLTPMNCSVVGDEPVDMAGAKAAGARAIGLPRGFFSEEELRKSGADVIIPSLAQLPELLKGVA